MLNCLNIVMADPWAQGGGWGDPGVPGMAHGVHLQYFCQLSMSYHEIYHIVASPWKTIQNESHIDPKLYIVRTCKDHNTGTSAALKDFKSYNAFAWRYLK